jgi:hypothetical protein
LRCHGHGFTREGFFRGQPLRHCNRRECGVSAVPWRKAHNHFPRFPFANAYNGAVSSDFISIDRLESGRGNDSCGSDLLEHARRIDRRIFRIR